LDVDGEAGAPGEADAADEPAATGLGHVVEGKGGGEEAGTGAAAANMSGLGRELTQADLASTVLAWPAMGEAVSSESSASSSFSSLSSLSE